MYRDAEFLLPSAVPGPPRRRPAAVRILAGALAAAMLAAVAPDSPAQARNAPESFADLADRLLPSVVNVNTTQTIERSDSGVPQFPPGSQFEDFFKEFQERFSAPNRPRRATSHGSGFIVDSGGVIVTNNHVIEGAEEISVVLQDNTTLPAEVIGRDPKTDIALLRVQPDKKLSAVKFGDSSATRVGDWVLAVGNPFGLGGSVTAGIVSARARDINSGHYDDFLQTDASINRGNSGGPMFNLDGEVIGINTAIFSPSGGSVGVGFAIPSALAKRVVKQLSEFGHTRRGWLGVRIQAVTDEIAESLELDDARGALVAAIAEGGPAEAGDIEVGDVILKFDGKDVPEMRRLPRIVAETEVGSTVGVEIWREGKTVKTKIKVGELEEAEEAGLLDPDSDSDGNGGGGKTVLGMTLSRVTPELREKHDLPDDVRGVVVTDVAVNSPAEKANLRPGDVILDVQQDDVEEPGQVVSKVEEMRALGRTSILVQRERQGDPRFVGVPLDDR